MAPQLTRWGLAIGIACIAIAGVYLSPRGNIRYRRLGMVSLDGSDASDRARTLADRWRAADRRARLATYRDVLAPMLRSRRAFDQASVAGLIDGPDSLGLRSGATLQRGLDSLWGRLGLGATKVGVGVVIDLHRSGAVSMGPSAHPSEDRWSVIVALPDSADHSTCVVVVPGWSHERLLNADVRDLGAARQLADWLVGVTGPCAFYARFGAPSARVRAWLGRRQFDLAESADWTGAGSNDWMAGYLLVDPRRRSWWWPELYELEPGARACLGGRRAACRAAITGDDSESLDSIPTVVTLPNPRAINLQPIIGGGRYLADVARAVGDERFRDFWTADQPVDTALSLALRRPVGTWTAGWQLQVSPRPPLGPAPGLADLVFGVLVAGGCVVAAMLGMSRRVVG